MSWKQNPRATPFPSHLTPEEMARITGPDFGWPVDLYARMLEEEAPLPAEVQANQRRVRLDAARQQRQAYPLRQFVKEAWAYLEPQPYVHGWHIDALCAHLQAVVETAAAADECPLPADQPEIRNLLVNVPPRTSKPVDIDALVLLHDGTRKRLGDICVGDRVITHHGRPARVLEVHEQGELDCLTVTTFHGRKLSAAPDHPFLTPEGWVQAKDLRIGQALAVVPAPVIESRATHSDAEFSLAGYFVGDGCVAYSDVQKKSFFANITSGTDEYTKEVLRCAEQLGFGVSLRAKTSKSPVYCISLSKGVRPWLQKIGLAGHNSYTKRVPAFVFAATPAQIRCYLAAYFHCDGYFSFRVKSPKRGAVIGFCSVSKELLQDTQHLLLRFGIHAKLRIRVKEKETTFTKAGYTYWVLDISSEEEMAKFLAEIPIAGYKKDRLEGYAPLRKHFALPWLSDPIVAIESGGRKVCRCLSLDRDHAFTANDLVVHNSLICAVFWPAWTWLTWPACRWLYVSYAGDLALRDATYSRSLMQSAWYQGLLPQPAWTFTTDQNVKGYYANSEKGYRISTSVGGKATGFGADIRVGDDLHSTSEDFSTTRAEIQAAKQFWTMTMASRTTNAKRACQVLVGQRVALDDVSGEVLKRGDYAYLKIPMEYEPDHTAAPTPLDWIDPRTEAGELLCPARFDQTEVTTLKSALGHRFFTQYQQRPVTELSSLFPRSRWQFFHVWPPMEWFDVLVQSWDYRFGDAKATGSFVAGHVWGRKGSKEHGHVYLLDRVFARLSFEQSVDETVRLAEKWPGAYAKLIEQKANGEAIYSTLRSRVFGLQLVPVGGRYSSKPARAEAVTYLQKEGRAWVPHPTLCPWIDEYLDHMERFPSPPDDDTDCTSQAWSQLCVPPPAKDTTREQLMQREALLAKMRQAMQRSRTSTGTGV